MYFSIKYLGPVCGWQHALNSFSVSLLYATLAYADLVRLLSTVPFAILIFIEKKARRSGLSELQKSSYYASLFCSLSRKTLISVCLSVLYFTSAGASSSQPHGSSAGASGACGARATATSCILGSCSPPLLS